MKMYSDRQLAAEQRPPQQERRERPAAAAAPEPRLTKTEIAELLERGYPEVFRWEDDDIALKSAAAHSRLPHDKLSSGEMGAFEEEARDEYSRMIYLQIRNKILQLWLLEPNVECTKEHAIEGVVKPFNSDRSLIMRVHAYLERYGYINYGVFHRIGAPVPHQKKRVIVIGAGASGLAAASQLKRFGYDVIVLEAHAQTGGRVKSFTSKRKMKVDLGAMVVMGVCGNPLITLTKQFKCTVDRLNGSHCVVYDMKGKSVDARKDQLIEEFFRQLGDIAAYLVHEKGVEDIRGELMDLETAYDNIMCIMELRVQKKRQIFFQTYEKVMEAMKVILEEMTIFKKTAIEIGKRISEMEEREREEREEGKERREEKEEKDILFRCLKRDLINALKKYDGLELRKKNVEAFLANLKRMEPNACHLNAMDRKILDFHMANLEYANGTQLRNLSAKHWDQDDENEIVGSHMTIREGMHHLISKFACSADVKTNRRVTKIEYSEKGVLVHCNRTERKTVMGEELYEGDAVLCTMPLGVLKKVVEGEKNYPVFEPSLPEAKVDAIRRVGYGNLNKIVLFFDEVFWEPGVHFFGSCNVGNDRRSKSSRGELYMFMAAEGKPALIGLLAGEAADLKVKDVKLEGTMSMNELLVVRAMQILNSVFGTVCPPTPSEVCVTNWHQDDTILGCYSYMAVNSEGKDYDTLAEPVRCKGVDGVRSGSERVFFAGEHTNRNYPATVHGAVLSGFREAGRIADILGGCPYVKKVDGEVITLESDEESEEEEMEEDGEEEEEESREEEGEGENEESEGEEEMEVEEQQNGQVDQSDQMNENGEEEEEEEEMPTL